MIDFTMTKEILALLLGALGTVGAICLLAAVFERKPRRLFRRIHASREK